MNKQRGISMILVLLVAVVALGLTVAVIYKSMFKNEQEYDGKQHGSEYLRTGDNEYEGFVQLEVVENAPEEVSDGVVKELDDLMNSMESDLEKDNLLDLTL